jgi:ribosomal protein S18 acetylase RimI-like enzyme
MTIDDLPAVFTLGERLFRAEDLPTLYRTWDEYELLDFYSSDSRFCLVAESDKDKIIGFVTGSMIEKRRSAWTYGYLAWLGIEPVHEGHGIARRLVSRLTELFITEGARMMLLDTETDNTRAIRFFERMGFGNPVQHVYMTRNLTNLPAYKRKRGRNGIDQF